MNPLISIIIPVHNGERFLKDALSRAEAQTYHPIEIIVVDDGSIDQSRKIAQSFSAVHYDYYPCRSPAIARNRGLELAKGKFITFLDCDDYWSLDALNQLATVLISHPDTDMTQGLVRFFATNEHNQSYCLPLNPYYVMQLGAILSRRIVFERIGNFDLGLYSGQDMDWLVRAWEYGLIKKRINRVVLYYRRHQTNLTNTLETFQKGRLVAFQRHLKRIREQGFNPAGYDRSSLLDYLGAWPGEISA